jgi:hypothetical protein
MVQLLDWVRRLAVGSSSPNDVQEQYCRRKRRSKTPDRAREEGNPEGASFVFVRDGE